MSQVVQNLQRHPAAWWLTAHPPLLLAAAESLAAPAVC